MPDRFGFDHLTAGGAVEVRCVEDGCGAHGPLHRWPEELRERHAAAHEQTLMPGGVQLQFFDVDEVPSA